MKNLINQTIKTIGSEDLATLCQALKLMLCLENSSIECFLKREKKERYIIVITNKQKFVIDKKGVKKVLTF